MKSLVIVESPSKTAKIKSFLGQDYEVLSSVGHIRDLVQPKNVPVAKKKQFGKFSVDIDNNFEAYYDVVDNSKKEVIKKLKQAASKADRILLATDEDREGEAIAWHILDVLKPKQEVKRMVFNEITKSAVLESLNNLRPLDMNLVNAQESRRILDRLFGYSVSPILWRKIAKNLSAGRVQSPALRLIVEREMERIAFIEAKYYDIDAVFDIFKAKLFEVDGKQIAGGKDFDDLGNLKNPDVQPINKQQAEVLQKHLQGKDLLVSDIKSRAYRKSPASPFTTSSLQQEALNRLNLSATQTMRAAQKLYEQGYITYMRTDSNQLSQEAIERCRQLIEEKYTKKFLNSSVRTYTNRSKNAQEAHEAIRPAGDFTDPKTIDGILDEDQFKLYTLIYKRTLASQMTDQEGTTTTLILDVENCKFKASGTVIEHQGFDLVYSTMDKDTQILPEFQYNSKVQANSFDILSHTTKPPARYTDATLVKKLEDLGIGRPSTYASIIQTLIDRKYVIKHGKALVPFWSSFSVIKLLKEGFPELIDYDFTKNMEDSLDDIAHGVKLNSDYLKDFYFGNNDNPGLKETVSKNLDNVDTIKVNTIEFGNGYVVRTGKYGSYIEDENSEPDANGKRKKVYLKENMTPDELSEDNIQEFYKTIQTQYESRPLGKHPESGNLITVQDGRYGPYVTEHYAKKQIHSALLKSQDILDITLADAIQLLSLPREIGEDPKTNNRITAHNGPYGPYIKAGSEIRSLTNEEDLFTIGLDQALELLAVPRTRKARTKESVKEFGKNKDGQIIAIYKGRYGDYISDGKTNLTVSAKMDVQKMTLEEAEKLLAEKSAKKKN